VTTLPLSADELLTTTRSVRKRLDLSRPVPPDLIRECLEIALQAPSGWGSLLPAVWSYMLAARARGLGTAWTTLHLAHEAEAARILGLPADVRQGALIPTAYYTGDSFRPAAREPLDSVLHLDRW
jgi:nitroreductase